MPFHVGPFCPREGDRVNLPHNSLGAQLETCPSQERKVWQIYSAITVPRRQTPSVALEGETIFLQALSDAFDLLGMRLSAKPDQRPNP